MGRAGAHDRAVAPRRGSEGSREGGVAGLSAPAAAAGRRTLAAGPAAPGLPTLVGLGQARVGDLEAGLAQALDVVDDRPVDELGTRGVDQDRETVRADDVVVCAGLGEGHAELDRARAAAAPASAAAARLGVDADADLRLLAAHEGLHLFGGRGSNLDVNHGRSSTKV